MSSKDLMSTKQEVIDSLLACLLVICRINGVAITKDALTAGLPLEDGCITPALVKRAVARAKMVSNILKKPLNSIRAEFMPSILLLKVEEACVMLGWDADKQNASVIFPELGDAEIKVPLQDLEQRYSGYAIVIKP